MTIGIKLPADQVNGEEGFFIYLDAVMSYTRGQKGQVTKNPTARGRYVTDSFVADNPSYTISGVVSFADISSVYSLIRDEDGRLADNLIDQPSAVTIQQSTNKLLNFLPTSISQFFDTGSPNVSMDGVRNNYKDFVESCFEKLMSGKYFDDNTQKTKTRIRPVKLYEYDGVILTKTYEDLCLTSYTVKESVESGNALFIDLQFEKVEFVQLKKTSLSPDVVKSLKPKSTAKAKKGNVSSTGQEVDTAVEKENDTDPLIKAAATGGKD